MSEKAQHLEEIRRKYLLLTEEFLKQGASIKDLELITFTETNNKQNKKSGFQSVFNKKSFIVVTIILFYSIFVQKTGIDFVIKYTQSARCLIPNNYLVWEFTRPVSNCDFCLGVDSVIVLDNITKEEFKKYAYSSKPIIVKKAASHWLASKVFSLQFFHSLYEQINGAYESVEEECQFLHFQSNFANLKEVFDMSYQRAMNFPGEDTWYIGWKNCHPQVVEIMKKFYEAPHFLPDDAEIPNSNYIFLGYEEGAQMHIDYIRGLMWAGQIIGSKTWTIAPTPECEEVCQRFSFFVDTGDIILLDTKIWYHSTHVENKQFSLTVTSEYG